MSRLIPINGVYVLRVHGCGSFIWQAAYYNKDGFIGAYSGLFKARNEAIEYAQKLADKYDTMVQIEHVYR